MNTMEEVPLESRVLLRLPEVAVLCGVSVTTAHEWVKRGGLPTVARLKQKRVTRKALDAWLDENPVEA